MRFHWSESHKILTGLLTSHQMVATEGLHEFVDATDPAVRFRPPLIQPITPATAHPDAWLRVPDDPGTFVILLVQAGASSMGWFADDDCIAHKVIRRYVKRGTGRSQTTHLNTKGKSRYGSRLRLQNAKRQLQETNQKLESWWADLGAPDRVFASIPVRTWPDLLATDPPPPFERDDAIKIPYDVYVPDHEELLRVKRLLVHGEIVPGTED